MPEVIYLILQYRDLAVMIVDPLPPQTSATEAEFPSDAACRFLSISWKSSPSYAARAIR